MSIKTRIKNDMWQFNYVLPFVKKHQFDEKGKIDLIKRIVKAYSDIKPVKGKGPRSVANDTKSLLDKIDVCIELDSRFIYFIDIRKTIAVPGNILSNFTLDYNKIIYGTFEDLVNKAYGDDTYGREARLLAEGVYSLVNRIIETVKYSKMDADEKDKHLLYFSRMLNSRAVHFEEALQRILFFNQILWQTRHRLNGLGRLDKILDDLYQADIQNGCIDKEQATEIVGDFLKQLSKYSNYKSDALEGDIGQIIILGGLNIDGSYFCNELTEIFLKEQAKLGKPDPKTLLRVSKNMPDELLRLAVECLVSKTGSPLFSNDDVVIPALLDFDVSAADAYEYCTSACWEPFIVGKSLDQNNIAVFDYFSALDEVLQEDADSFDILLEKYIEQNSKKFEVFLKSLNQIKWAKDPLVSLFTAGCSESRTDISDGSCQYKNYGITTVALSNVIDSLLNIKKVVFEEKILTLSEANKIRKDNFKDNATLYDELCHLRKHYGHDEEEVILLVSKITDTLAQVARRYKNPYGGTVKFGLSSPGYNILSKKTNADFAGRKQGMPYNTHISCLDASYTEVVSFASKLVYINQKFNGNVVDFFAAPDFIKRNSDKFVIFLKGAIHMGFFQMQMNLMDSKTLIDAKRNPQKYAGLIVRVWGFSAYFNDLPESYKDLLIERAIAAEKLA